MQRIARIGATCREKETLSPAALAIRVCKLPAVVAAHPANNQSKRGPFFTMRVMKPFDERIRELRARSRRKERAVLAVKRLAGDLDCRLASAVCQLLGVDHGREKPADSYFPGTSRNFEERQPII
jgi:hypothetical protein